ncbi:MAG: RsmF rRNA methyltransferase first C-terminal domain-containing protein [Lachnospiraceae bacterium]|nr:RsmF rRNA methyltransferase first C-terminal domain-containing protein [Lachnospiraceae bacterium]
MTNLPEEFEKRMKEMLGGEYEAFKASFNESRRIGIRVNTLKTDTDTFLKLFPGNPEKIKWCETGFFTSTDEKYGRLSQHDAGAFYMQEPSAQAVAASLGSVMDLKGRKVLDLCAAPGGKSTQLASMMAGEGVLVSNEINRERAAILSSNIERMGVRNCVVLNETPERIAETFENWFDAVVVDAPCSGEGMFRKDETALREWSPANVEMCADRQKDILREAVKTLKDGGILVYSTCTFAVDEDEKQMAEFLCEYPEFEIIECENFKFFDKGFTSFEFEGKKVSDDPKLKESLEKCARLWPHKIDGEGHFICILKKRGSDETVGEKKKKKSERNNRPDKKSIGLIKDFFSDMIVNFEPDFDNTVCFADSVYLLPKDFNISLKGLKIQRAGLLLGEIKKDRFEPSHSLAMALNKNNCIRCAELDEDEALKFRHGEELRKDLPNGWTLMLVNGVSLGWGKVANGAIKNHYPKGLRIKF